MKLKTSQEEQKKILLVDDDKLCLDLVRDFLKHSDYSIRTAVTGQEACVIVREWQPDVILLDLTMPGMDGLETCSVIREMKLNYRPSILVVSSKTDKQVIADALNRGADDFVSKPINDVELTARVAAQARLSSIYRELDIDKQNLEAMLAITNTIGASLNTGDILETIVSKVAGLTNALRCSIVLISANDEAYVLATHENPDFRDYKIDLRKYPEIKEVMKSKKALTVENMANHPLLQPVRNQVQNLVDISALVLPIVINEEVLGTLFLRARRKHSGFTKKEIDACQIIANASYHAIKNARLYEKVVTEREMLREIAITDQLTSLYNHNFFYNRLEEEFDRSIRYDNSLSLLMIDMDDFKRINDRYGHRAGDAVLIEMSAIIKKCVRKSDFVARYGGEEFAVILPQTPAEGAAIEAEKVRKVISEHCYAGLIKENLTVSVGVSAFPGKGIMSSGDLVNTADQALYSAKRTGKNKVVLHQP